MFGLPMHVLRLWSYHRESRNCILAYKYKAHLVYCTGMYLPSISVQVRYVLYLSQLLYKFSTNKKLHLQALGIRMVPNRTQQKAKEEVLQAQLYLQDTIYWLRICLRASKKNIVSWYIYYWRLYDHSRIFLRLLIIDLTTAWNILFIKVIVEATRLQYIKKNRKIKGENHS